jgi:dTDP-glucose pyrophosphorylase
MNLILTMAGQYSRFINEGYKIPKFLLPWRDKTILSEILKEMSPNFDNVYLVVHKKDSDFFSHIKSLMVGYNIPLNNLVILDSSESQSETVLKCLKFITVLNGPIVIHNIDTILYNRDYQKIKSILQNNDGFIDIFSSNNPNYSYVINSDNKIIEISEKILISECATSGLYGFKNKEIYFEYYNNGYISKIYDKMITNGLNILCGDVYSENNTLVLGTPNEYLNLSKTINV